MKGNELIFKEKIFPVNKITFGILTAIQIGSPKAPTFLPTCGTLRGSTWAEPTQCPPSFLHFSPQKQSDSVKLMPYTTSLLENLGGLSRSLWQFGIKPITLYRRQHKMIGLLKTVNALCRNISDQSSLLTQTFWRVVEMGGDKLEWVTLNAPQRRRSSFYKSPVLFLPKSILVQLE